MKKLSILFIAVALLSSCKNEDKEEPVSAKENKTIKVEEKKKPVLEQFCYLAVVGEKEHLKDTTELNLQFTREGIKGEYNWIPAEKDARKGTFEGEKVAKNTIKAKYIYMQEGQEQSKVMIIKMTENAAKVSLDPGSDFETTTKLKKVTCN